MLLSLLLVLLLLLLLLMLLLLLLLLLLLYYYHYYHRYSIARLEHGVAQLAAHRLLHLKPLLEADGVDVPEILFITGIINYN